MSEEKDKDVTTNGSQNESPTQQPEKPAQQPETNQTVEVQPVYNPVKKGDNEKEWQEKGYDKFDKNNDGILSEEQHKQYKDYSLSITAKTEADEKYTRYEDSIKNVKSNIDTSVKGGSVNNQYNKIIYQSFTVGGEGRGKSDYTKSNEQICDILDNYRWTLDTFNKVNTYSVNSQDGLGISGNKDNNLSTVNVGNIPHCYLIQYQQRYSSNITNFINTMVAAVNAVNDESTIKGVTGIGEGIDALKNTLMKAVMGDNEAEGDGKGDGEGATKLVSQAFNAIRGSINDLAGMTVSKVAGKIQNPIQNSKYLAPYKLLYDLTATNMRYVFPMVAQPPINRLINDYGDKQDDGSVLTSNSLITWFNKVATGIVNYSRDLKDFGSLLGTTDGSGYQLSHVEKAKFFNYPTNTEQYTITFPLLNTVRQISGSIPEWQKNYKFIMLFTLRNMVFRRDNASFFPPLFYDLIIPGVIRQPYCYVKQVSVKPIGLTRMLGMDNLFSFLPSGQISVAVPQAWIVTIKVKSLLSATSNMVLSGLTDLSIKVKTDKTN